MEPAVLGTSDDESGSDSWSDESDAVASELGNDDETSEDDESDDGLSDDDESDDGSEDGDSEGGDSEDGESEDAEDEDDGSSRRPERKERLYTANDMRAALRLILSAELLRGEDLSAAAAAGVDGVNQPTMARKVSRIPRAS